LYFYAYFPALRATAVSLCGRSSATNAKASKNKNSNLF
jgi:hypothetical protein